MPNSRTPRIIGRVIRSLFGLFVFAVCALMIWRVFFSARIPSEVDHLLPNQRICAAYEEKGDGLILLYQDQASITRSEGAYGYFSVPRCVFIPEAEQVQIVFRYNNSTIRKVAVDKGLDDVPDRSMELFDVTLVRTADLTPDDPTDNTDRETLSETRYFPTQVIRTNTSLYTYYRLVFEGVSVEADTVGVFADVYYLGDKNYNESPYGALCLYDNGSAWLTYKMTTDDRKALAGK